MTATCIVCESTDITTLYKGLLKCRHCNYVFADLALDESDFRGLYKQDYFFGEEYANYLADRRTLQKNFELRLKSLAPYLDRNRHRRLFEIGSAYGFFLDLARDRFESAEGIDITEDGVRHARETLGLQVYEGDFLEKDFGDKEWDVVCLWDTLEHLRSPHLYLAKAARHVRSGALLAITTGDIGSLSARIQGKSWRLIHPPTHAHYFSAKTLRRLLSNWGFEILYNRPCGFYRSVDHAAYNILVLREKGPWLYRLIRKTGFGRWDFYLNLFDIMYVIARKR